MKNKKMTTLADDIIDAILNCIYEDMKKYITAKRRTISKPVYNKTPHLSNVTKIEVIIELAHRVGLGLRAISIHQFTPYTETERRDDHRSSQVGYHVVNDSNAEVAALPHACLFMLREEHRERANQQQRVMNIVYRGYPNWVLHQPVSNFLRVNACRKWILCQEPRREFLKKRLMQYRRKITVECAKMRRIRPTFMNVLSCHLQP